MLLLAFSNNFLYNIKDAITITATESKKLLLLFDINVLSTPTRKTIMV